MYILLNTDFLKDYRKFASLSYTIATKLCREINDFLFLKSIKLRVSCSIATGELSYGILNN